MLPEVVWIEGVDGTPLCADLYLPAGEGSFAALLEALPYRKDDVTASYRPSYKRFVDAGFAVCRLDLRGTGSSGGIATDEYPDVERADLRAVVEWLAAQPWSSGRVGMFGTSYSGFNSLHMAAEGCLSSARWWPPTPPTTATRTTSTTAAAYCARST